MRNYLRGFTLIEVMVTVSIIAILSAFVYADFNESRKQVRDAQRKADLRNLQNAIELYKSKYGQYPEGCASAGSWSTEESCPSNYIKGGTIPGLGDRPFSEFITPLPKDPKLNGTGSGYMYTVNSDFTVYKIMAHGTVESEIIADNSKSEFARCGDLSDGNNECDAVLNAANGNERKRRTPCRDDTTDRNLRKSDYALKGGYANGNTPKAVEYNSEIIRCK